jgi:hypothetical protein
MAPEPAHTPKIAYSIVAAAPARMSRNHGTYVAVIVASVVFALGSSIEPISM